MAEDSESETEREEWWDCETEEPDKNNKDLESNTERSQEPSHHSVLSELKNSVQCLVSGNIIEESWRERMKCKLDLLNEILQSRGDIGPVCQKCNEETLTRGIPETNTASSPESNTTSGSSKPGSDESQDDTVLQNPPVVFSLTEDLSLLSLEQKDEAIAELRKEKFNMENELQSLYTALQEKVVEQSAEEEELITRLSSTEEFRSDMAARVVSLMQAEGARGQVAVGGGSIEHEMALETKLLQQEELLQDTLQFYDETLDKIRDSNDRALSDGNALDMAVSALLGNCDVELPETEKGRVGVCMTRLLRSLGNTRDIIAGVPRQYIPHTSTQ